jgi:hypothetical protein
MSPNRVRWNAFTYALAVVAVGGGAAGMHVGKSRGLLTLIKKPIPLQKDLKQLDRNALAPLELVAAPQLSSDIVGELGTDIYINWHMKDPRYRAAAKQNLWLSVTYYTGVQDQVPHVPEECMRANALTQVESEKLIWRLDNLDRDVAVRRLGFLSLDHADKRVYVYYTINVNGDFYNERQLVRLRMADADESHMYFSKVEIMFDPHPPAERNETDSRAREVLEKALSELVRSHWPPRGSEKGGFDPKMSS